MEVLEPGEPAITVAIPTFNGSRQLRAALDSVRRSSIPHHLVIVDDRSDDDTLAIARELVGDQARVELNSERLGLARNWNRCVELSPSPVVALFHQDDLMLPHHLEEHLAVHRANPLLGWVASAADVIDEAGHPVAESIIDRGGLGAVDLVLDDGRGVEALAITNPLRCSAVTINRAAHLEVGGFDPSYRYVVDWDYWIRLANIRPVAWRAQTTVAIRWHLQSETHRFSAGTVDLEETARLLGWIDRHLDIYTDFYPEWRRLADARLGRAYLNRAYVGFKQGRPDLSRRALLRSCQLAPGQLLKNLLTDPRLSVQMGATWLAPGWVRRSQHCRDIKGEPIPTGGARLPDPLE